MNRFFPVFVMSAVSLACGGADGDAGPRTADAEDLVSASATASCKKHVYIHIANFSWFEDPANAGVPLNGCWGYDMFQRFQHGWAHFKDHTPTMVDPGAPLNAAGPRRWVYNET